MRKSVNAQVLNGLLRSVIIVELLNSEDSAYFVLALLRQKRALVSGQDSARLLPSCSALWLLVELRETESSAHPNPETNAKGALVPGSRWCSLSPVSLRSVIVVELHKATPSAYPAMPVQRWKSRYPVLAR